MREAGQKQPGFSSCLHVYGHEVGEARRTNPNQRQVFYEFHTLTVQPHRHVESYHPCIPTQAMQLVRCVQRTTNFWGWAAMVADR